MTARRRKRPDEGYRDSRIRPFGGILGGMKTTRTIITDDFDGSEDGVETVRFSLAGVDYDIDLSAEHVRELEAALEPFVSAGHRVGGKARRTTAPAVSGGPDPKAVRAWAIEQGIDVSARGRVAKGVIDRYLLAA